MLNNLIVVNGSMEPAFDRNTLNYQVIVPDTVISLVLDYDLDEGATVVVYGNDYLSEGTNHVLIETYNNNELVTYVLEVYKESSQTSSKEMDVFSKVEVENNSTFLGELIFPSIIVVTIFMIIVLFYIIFHKSKSV